MKRSLLSSGMVAAMLLVAPAAFAQTPSGLNLSWTNCLGDAGTTNFTFACASNVGSRSMVGTFTLANDLLFCSGIAPLVDLVSQDPVIPEWWDLKETGSCRPTGISIAAQDGASCPDWAVGQASMNLASYSVEGHIGHGGHGPNTARIKMLNAVTSAALQDLVAGQEYGAFRLNINSQLTTGAGSCAGCLNPVCIVLNRVQVDDNTGASVIIENALNPGSHTITWQGVGADCLLVPVKNATWGAVKALYR